MMEGMVGESGGVADAFITSLAMILVTEVRRSHDNALRNGPRWC